MSLRYAESKIANEGGPNVCASVMQILMETREKDKQEAEVESRGDGSVPKGEKIRYDCKA